MLSFLEFDFMMQKKVPVGFTDGSPVADKYRMAHFFRKDGSTHSAFTGSQNNYVFS